MRCFACNNLVAPNMLDSKTDRYYCAPCMAPTTEIQLQQLDKDLEAIFGSGKDVDQRYYDLPYDGEAIREGVSRVFSETYDDNDNPTYEEVD